MTRAAAHAAGWATTQGRKSPWVLSPSGSAGSRAIQGPNDPIGLKVEILMGAYGWVDVSSNTYYRDRIRVSRGRSNETSQPPPQTAGLTLNNRGGIFTPRNATGPYYGLIGRNTPIRISRTWNGERFYRYAGEIPAWPTTSDISGRDVYEQITASGPLRRLVQGTAPLRSPMFRGITNGTTASLVTQYWPCEDLVGSSSFTSGIPGGAPLTFTGLPQLSSNTSFVSSAALPVMNGGALSYLFPPSLPGGTANVLRFLMSVPTAGEPDDSGICLFETTGTCAYFQVLYFVAGGGSLQAWGLDANLNTLFLTTLSYGINGKPVRVSAELVQSGSNVNWALTVLAPGGTAQTINGSFAGVVGPVTSFLLNVKAAAIPLATAYGHITYQSTWDSIYNLAGPLNAWIGEPPDAAQTNDVFGATSIPFTTSRFTRLCLEENINPVVVASPLGYDVDPGPTAPVGMGYQTIDTFPTLLQQVPDTSAGLMYEPRDQVGLAMRTRASIYNQPAKLTLDHSQHQLSGPLKPVDDDQQVRNDIIVTRINGSSASAVKTTGALSIQGPPNGVGDYQTQYELSLASDLMLADAAGWRLLLGTVDGPRYPSLMLNLRHPTFTGNTAMMNAVLSLDIGDRIVIVNPPPEFPPDPISLIVQGYSETMGIYEHDMVITCSPESPYEIGVLDDPVLGRADTDGSTLAQTYPLGTEITLQVATTGAATGSPLWTTSAGDLPFDVMVSGERMTVTNITGASSPQTFTVTRSVNGVVKSQTAGADVRLAQPTTLSL